MGIQRLVFLIIVLSLKSHAITYNAEYNHLDANDIQDIYLNHVAKNFTTEYKYRYSPLPFHKNNKKWRWEGKDFPRVVALLEFEKYINDNGIKSEKTLCIDGRGDPEIEYLTSKHLRYIDYDEDPVHNDLHNLQIDEDEFDFVMANQVFEHIYDPIRCLKNVAKCMKVGGIVYFNIPTLNILHSTPWHYYSGFTPTGVGALVRAAGFKILSIGQWGNLTYIHQLFSTLSWPDFTSMANESKDFSVNDFERPVITWVFAQKTAGQA